jgi:hypothetical protein
MHDYFRALDKAGILKFPKSKLKMNEEDILIVAKLKEAVGNILRDRYTYTTHHNAFLEFIYHHLEHLANRPENSNGEQSSNAWVCHTISTCGQTYSSIGGLLRHISRAHQSCVFCGDYLRPTKSNHLVKCPVARHLFDGDVDVTLGYIFLYL